MAKPMEWWSRSAAAKYGEGEEEGKGEERDTSEDLRYPPWIEIVDGRSKKARQEQPSDDFIDSPIVDSDFPSTFLVESHTYFYEKFSVKFNLYRFTF